MEHFHFESLDMWPKARDEPAHFDGQAKQRQSSHSGTAAKNVFPSLAGQPSGGLSTCRNPSQPWQNGPSPVDEVLSPERHRGFELAGLPARTRAKSVPQIFRVFIREIRLDRDSAFACTPKLFREGVTTAVKSAVRPARGMVHSASPFTTRFHSSLDSLKFNTSCFMGRN